MSNQKKLGIIILSLSLTVGILLFSLHTKTEKEEKNNYKNEDSNAIKLMSEEELAQTQKEFNDTHSISNNEIESDFFQKSNETIDNFYTYINEGNYEKAYKCLDKEYTEDYDITVEKLTIAYPLNDIFYYEIIDFNYNDGQPVLKAIVFNDTQSIEDERYFTIYRRQEGFKIADRAILTSQALDIEKEEKGLLVNINKFILQDDGFSFKIKLENISNEIITIEDILLINENNNKFIHKNLNTIPFDYTMTPSHFDNLLLHFPNSIKPRFIKIILAGGQEIDIKL